MTTQQAAPTATADTGRVSGTSAVVEEALAALDLDAKVRLLTGATAWRLHPLPEVGLRSVVVSDGPVGVRGTGETPDETSLLFPSPSALAATWDLDLASRLGALFAREARRHGVDVVLAPQVNLQRTPVAGRHFECFSEDPLLTSEVAGALVAAMQRGGVAACVKHYVANDSETDRTRYLARVDERTLREVYLAPFEHLVREVGAWSVMAAYNQVDDGVLAAPATEHAHLLVDVLKEEWGFDGVVVSDWLAATRTVEPALGGLDLVMPGPGGPWEQHLLDAVRVGDVDEGHVDDKVRRLLVLAERTGALTGEADGSSPHAAVQPVPPADPADARLLRGVAARSTVVLRDELGALPVDVARVGRVAVVGPNAAAPYVLGGGSSYVRPPYVVDVEAGLRAALPRAEVTVHRGGDARRHAPALDPARCRDPRTGAPGVRTTLLAADGRELGSTVGAWTGRLELADEVEDVRVEVLVDLTEPGEHRLEVGTVGRWSVRVDDVEVASGHRVAGADVVLDSSVNAPDGHGGTVTVTEPRAVHLVATLQNIRAGAYGSFARGELRHRPPGPGVEDEIAEAVAAAAVADLVVVVVGTNDEVESEGWDRTDLALPGRQDELVERVLDVAPDAVVVVNAGAPVLLPWLDRARTVLWSWFPGQECGHALADVLTGVTEPAGRLPWTLPARVEDVPVPHAVPQDGVVAYAEGVHVGYRSWERSGAGPAAPFGHGLGWTGVGYADGAGPHAADVGWVVAVTVPTDGARPGTEVVQVYVEPPTAGTDRPVRWLAGFATTHLDAGRSATVTVPVPARALRTWDVPRGRWSTPAGEYRLRVGRSVRDLRLETALVIR